MLGRHALMAWTLITVTGAGDVKHSRGYETLHMCEQARSVALTGMTIEQNAEADRQYKEQVASAAKKWRDAHPPRKPTAAEKKKYEEMVIVGAYGPFTNLGEDGLLYDWPGGGVTVGPAYRSSEGESFEFVRGNYRLKTRHDVKFAQCVQEAPSAEKENSQ